MKKLVIIIVLIISGGCKVHFGEGLSVMEAEGHTIKDFLSDRHLPYEAPTEQQKIITEIMQDKAFADDCEKNEVKNFILSPDVISILLRNATVYGYSFFYIKEINKETLHDAIYLQIVFDIETNQLMWNYINNGAIHSSGIIESACIISIMADNVKKLHLPIGAIQSNLP